ncbi:hypothetical protein GCM10019059_43110 [Camelimonas fluminis]|uniref:Amidohydrolase n=1 Tax=Camelimonas fluminis TaxID=1576911 RepID=A0ABV7UPU1_9HYPH|nr:amidohydrolase [Camelimonas fluminis]GHE80183.1 hypothetical protein GCM10019059_43110 [Camelimonas fluminis]
MTRNVSLGTLALVLVLAGGPLPVFAQSTSSDQPAAAQPAAAPSDDGMVTVFTASKIVTMDPGWPEATAVAVKGGRILSVGTLQDLKPWLDKYPHKIDRQFESRVIYPGFVEAHSHPVIGATALTRPPLSYFPTANPYGPAFPGVKTRRAALAKLAEYVAASKDPSADVVAFGFDVVPMGGYLDKTELDKISTEKPIFVWDASEHFVFANTAAMKKRGLTKDLAMKFPGVGLGADGELNGQFLGELPTQYVLAPIITQLLTPQIAVKDAKYLSDLAQQAGVTTMSELAFGAINIPLEHEVLKTAFDTEAANQRLVVVVEADSFVKAYGANATAEAKKLHDASNDRLMFEGVKFFSDDSFLSFGMEMQNPGYVHSDKYHGVFMFDKPSDFVTSMKPWWDANYHIHVHTNGNAGNQATIDALDALQKEKPRFDHRFTFEHFGISTPEQARRVKALGGVVSINPYYVYARGDLNGPEIGVDRANTAARLKTLTDAGVVVSLHTDTPVAPPRPLEEVWIAVNRRGAISNKVLGPAERVSVNKALRMVTIDAAYTLGVDEKVGSIEAGKFADFVVLGDDPATVAPNAIRDVPVLATISGGRVISTRDTRKPPQ